MKYLVAILKTSVAQTAGMRKNKQFLHFLALSQSMQTLVHRVVLKKWPKKKKSSITICEEKNKHLKAAGSSMH